MPEPIDCDYMMRALAIYLLVSLAEGQLVFNTNTNSLEHKNECTTPDGRDGLCTDISKCIPLINLLRIRPVKAEVIAHLRKSICKFDGKRPHVCCPELKPYNPPKTTTTTEKTTTETTTTAETTTIRELPTTTAAPVTLPDVEVCGNSTYKTSTDQRIVNGKEAKRNAWPWIAALGFKASLTKYSALTYTPIFHIFNK